MRWMIPSVTRLGRTSALAMFLIGVAYIVAMATGMAIHGLSEPIVDPVLAVMEVLTLMSAPTMVVLMASIYMRASPERKVYGLVALAFAVLFAGTTTVVHLVELTAVRQLGAARIVWPSAIYAAELAAWDWFLGLALLFAAPVFPGDGRERPARRGLALTGVLCIAGLVGPAIGNMRLQFIGVAGYAVALPAVCLMLAPLRGRGEAPAPGARR